MLERILLGDSPFIGADALSQDRARESLTQLIPEKIVSVMRTSFASGANGFVFYTHPTNLAGFKLLRNQAPDISFDMYPLFPYAQGYVRDATEKGTLGMIMEHVQRLTRAGKVKSLLSGGLAAMTMNPYKMLTTSLDAEIDEFLKEAPQVARLRGIFLHDVIVDLSAALQLREIFEVYVSHVIDHYSVKPGLVTRNFPRLVSFLENSNISLREIMIMTPFNKLGFQMNPSKEACEETLAAKQDLDVVAMSILSAGLLDLESGLDYIKKVRNLRSIVVGVSREEHARTTFTALSGLKKTTTVTAYG